MACLSGLDGQLNASFCSATFENESSGCSTHSGSEAVDTHLMSFFWLERSLRHRFIQCVEIVVKRMDIVNSYRFLNY